MHRHLFIRSSNNENINSRYTTPSQHRASRSKKEIHLAATPETQNKRQTPTPVWVPDKWAERPPARENTLLHKTKKKKKKTTTPSHTARAHSSSHREARAPLQRLITHVKACSPRSPRWSLKNLYSSIFFSSSFLPSSHRVWVSSLAARVRAISQARALFTAFSSI